MLKMTTASKLFVAIHLMFYSMQTTSIDSFNFPSHLSKTLWLISQCLYQSIIIPIALQIILIIGYQLRQNVTPARDSGIYADNISCSVKDIFVPEVYWRSNMDIMRSGDMSVRKYIFVMLRFSPTFVKPHPLSRPGFSRSKRHTSHFGQSPWQPQLRSCGRGNRCQRSQTLRLF